MTKQGKKPVQRKGETGEERLGSREGYEGHGTVPDDAQEVRRPTGAGDSRGSGLGQMGGDTKMNEAMPTGGSSEKAS